MLTLVVVTSPWTDFPGLLPYVMEATDVHVLF